MKAQLFAGVAGSGMLLLGLAGCSAGGTDHPAAQGLYWTLVSAEGASVTVQATDGSCDNGPHATVHESSTAVTISITTKANPSSASCDSEGRLKLVTLPLKQPLGRRALSGCVPPKGSEPRDCTLAS